MPDEVGAWTCELCGRPFPIYQGRSKGGYFGNCECGARYHWSAGSEASRRVMEAITHA